MKILAISFQAELGMIKSILTPFPTPIMYIIHISPPGEFKDYCGCLLINADKEHSKRLMKYMNSYVK